MWPTQTQKTDHAPEPTDDLTAPAASEPLAPEAPTLESEPPPAADQPWNSASEEEWNEHRTTAWALAYVIHRIRSTPHPPILLPEQRRHFEKIVEMAAALIAEWQGQERDLAQQLGTRRPVAELATQPLDASPNQLDDNASDNVWTRQMLAPSYQFFLPENDEVEAASEAPSTESEQSSEKSTASEESETPAAHDYQI